MPYDKTFAPWVRYFVAALKKSGVKVKVTSSRRSRTKQAQLYSSPQGYPVAAPGTSQHEYGFAFDAKVNPPQYQAAAGSFWKSLGLWWSASDPIHFAAFDPSTWSSILSTLPQDQFLGAGQGFGMGFLGGSGAGAPVGVSGVSSAQLAPITSTSVVPHTVGRAPTPPQSVVFATPPATSISSISVAPVSVGRAPVPPR